MAGDEKIWIGRNGQKFGPYDEAVLRRWVAEGKVEADALAWRTGMPEWVPLATLLPGMQAPPPMPPPRADDWGMRGFSARDDGRAAPDARATMPPPPSLHWFVVLLLTMVTGGIFGWIWLFVQASWVGKVDKSSKALVLFILALVSYLVAVVVSTNHTPASSMAAGLIFIGAMIVIYVGIFSMADAIRRDTARRGLVVHIGGVTVFFLGVFYLQAVMTWLARWKDTGQTEPGPSQGAVWLALILPAVPILAAIAIPAYQNYLIRVQVVQGAALADPAKTAVTAYYNSHGQLPHDNVQAGLTATSLVQGPYVSSVDIADGRITVTFGGTANRRLTGGSLVLTPEMARDGMRFSCATDTIPVQYLPPACR